MSVNVSLRRISFPLEAMNLVTSSTIVIAYMFLNRMMYMIVYENVPPPHTHIHKKCARHSHSILCLSIKKINYCIMKRILQVRTYIEYLGKRSLVILCCHQIEGLTGVFAFMTRLPQYSIGPIKVVITLIIAHIVCRIPIVNFLFGFDKNRL